MPEQINQQIQQSTANQSQDVSQSPIPPQQQNTSPHSSVLTFILLLVGAVIGFLVGGSFTSYLGQRGYLGDIGLASAYYMIIPIPIFAFLSVSAVRGIKSLNKNYKIFGYASLFIITFSLFSSVFLIYSDYNERKAEETAIPSKVDFQIYKPSQNHPFSNLKEGFNPIKEETELRCRGIEYIYYGSTDGLNLTEMKANEPDCPEFNYTSQEKYDEALKAAKENSAFGKSKNMKVVIREVEGDIVLLVSEYLNDNDRLQQIYGIKGGTLIKIGVGNCILGDECENKYIEFYKSLEPINSS